MNANDWHFPMACPQCRATAGLPFRATTEREELVIDLRCRECRREWTLVAPSPMVFTKSEADQRRTHRINRSVSQRP